MQPNSALGRFRLFKHLETISAECFLLKFTNLEATLAMDRDVTQPVMCCWP